MNIDINELAQDLGLSRQNLNYHILKGRAGIIEKNGENKTSTMIIKPENVLSLIKWIGIYGRGNKSLLSQAYDKYTNIGENK